MKIPALLFCAFIVLAIFSCQEQEDLEFIGDEQTLITIKADHIYATCGYPTQVVVADSRGRILAVADLNSGSDTQITGPIADCDETVNLFFLGIGSKGYQAVGFLGIRKGSEFSGIAPQGNVFAFNETNLSLPSFTGFDNLTVSSDISSYSFAKSVTTDNKVMQYRNNKIFAQITSGGNGYFGFINVDESGSVRLDKDKINAPSLRKQISLEGFPNEGSINVSGSLSADGSMMDRFAIMQDIAPFESDMYYPSTVFPRYLTEFSHSKNDQIFYYRKTSTEPDFAFEPIGFSGKVVDDDPSNFSIQTAGKFDYYRVAFEGNMASLTIYARACDGTLTLPDFSKVKGAGAFPYSSLRTYNIMMYDHAGLEEDQKYFKRYSTGVVNPEQDYNVRIVSFGAEID
ncbi:hypothetical protein WBG78_00625 [Chryseolinea sp. T2]|uniref:hypothetical protein n=1 Tax=Chryseolinea sp. T2 TaxID=3129255 RepID=UPI003076B524